MKAAETTWENPLTPNKRLRELYTSMAELRLLETHLATTRRSRSIPSTRDEEACRVSTALSLLPADLTSDPTASIATSFLRGTKLADLNAKPAHTQLPVANDTTSRLQLAIGAALALASRKKGPIVLAYVYPTDIAISEWKPIFRLAAAHAAPIIFVALPSRAPKKPGQLAQASTACGVPGIPVDAADAVGLYRVAQESMLRARAGGGPVLMECIPFQLPGTKSPPADPIDNMRESLIRRKLADDAWFHSIEARFTARLKTAFALGLSS